MELNWAKKVFNWEVVEVLPGRQISVQKKHAKNSSVGGVFYDGINILKIKKGL
jgi:hypothetical protein